MKRRTLAAATVVPLATRGQGRGPSRIGFAHVGLPDLAAPRTDPLVSGVRASGFAGEIDSVVRLTGGDPARLTPVVAETTRR